MFISHGLNEKGIKEMDNFKEDFANSVLKALKLMPDCKERDTFITKIEEAVFFGAKAIASKNENFDSVKMYGFKIK